MAKRCVELPEDGRQVGARVEAEQLAEQHVPVIGQPYRLLVLDAEAISGDL
jgi:hypothetical protein